MLDSYYPGGVEYLRVLPEIILVLTGTLIMFLEAVMTGERKSTMATVSALGLLAAIPATFSASQGPAFQNMIVVDG